MKLTGFYRQDNSDREENDFYATHPKAIPPLMDFLGWQEGGKLILEPCCGEGHLSIMLEAFGHRVISTDLINRGYGLGDIDFLKDHYTQEFDYDAVVTNPPFKYAQEFVEKSLKLAPLVCMFLKLSFLESRKRVKFFSENPPSNVCVFIDRIPCSKNGNFYKNESNPICYSWFIWKRGYHGKPTIEWI